MTTRLAIHVEGTVQGVGFRPFVWRTASRLGLCGWVCNTGDGVEIEAQGEDQQIKALIASLQTAPAPIQVYRLRTQRKAPIDESEFLIIENHGDRSGAHIGADLAPCPSCLGELFDPGNRRWRYPFINCTACGPRYTIVRSMPYSRAATSMAAFPLCESCQHEFDSPQDRRFHAEANACTQCGPQLTLTDSHGHPVQGDPLAESIKRLLNGEILAIKGIGGFHLCCDARNRQAIGKLREGKKRPRKPLALMAANIASIQDELAISQGEADWLTAPEHPIVLLQRLATSQLPLELAPDLSSLGVMLPYSPLHYLLFHEAAGQPQGTDWLSTPQTLLLVMTSANPPGAPVIIDTEQALQSLEGISDAFLLHNREIVARNEDSVLRVRSDNTPCFLRRGRGFAPKPIALPLPGPRTLALGGDAKNTICLISGQQAFVSTHIGELDNPQSCIEFIQQTNHHYKQASAPPQRIACDWHPDFYGSQLAPQLTAEHAATLIPIQHHHAHIAAVMAEHGCMQPALGLALDGYGLGINQHAWGGELLLIDGADCSRLGHLSELNLPAGDIAGREPWRSAFTVLMQLGLDAVQRYQDEPACQILMQQWKNQAHLQPTSSLGRLLETAAALLGLLRRQSYEAEAAQRLESLATTVSPLPLGWRITDNNQLDFMPLLACLANVQDPVSGASLLFATLSAGLSEWVKQAAAKHDLTTVVFGGGCWANRWLDEAIATELQHAGLTVLRPQRLPPGDGGLSLGQAWAAMLFKEEN